MKKFFRIVLAVVVGVLLVNLIGLFILVGICTPSSNETTIIPKEGILKIDLSKVAIREQKTEDLNAMLSGSQVKSIGLRQAISAIHFAKTDPGVKCIYLKPEGSRFGLGSISEFRGALEDFRTSGKPVVAYLENPSTGSYYLASVADKLYVGAYSGATPQFLGLSSRLIFLKDLLDKLGVNVQLIRHGKYKSAGEMYVRNTASKENLQQNQEMISSVWETLVSQIAKSRSLSVADVNSALDELKLALPSDYVELGFADAALTRAELEEKLAVLCMVPSYRQVSMIPFAGYVENNVKDNFRATGYVAVIYANGEIVDGLDPSNVDGDRFASIIESVREDSSVKAVVLRVNSPGGSVVASEKIKNELDALKAVKPLVASYGDYAASGGYWISNNADRIFSNPGTITGSIGVFGMIPDFSSLIKNTAHVNIVSVNSNRHADMLGLTRPFTAEELAFMQKGIEAVYSKFIGIVADGRGLSVEAVDAIAQGRVWTGADALGIGLVDEIGTLEDAIAWAAAAAGDASMSSLGIMEYPKPATFVETLTALFEDKETDYSVGIWTKWLSDWQKGRKNYIFARVPYQLEPLQ